MDTSRPDSVADRPAPVSVMIVDDHEPFREVARTVVSVTDGFVLAAEACSGEEAIGTALTRSLDLVLMDIHLPGIDGVEATRHIVAAHPATVVVLLSTYSRLDLPADARTCGAAGYISKEDIAPGVITRIWTESGAALGERPGPPRP
jgi:two-component system, NarL family, invasion response regulator UvrY